MHSVEAGGGGSGPARPAERGAPPAAWMGAPLGAGARGVSQTGRWRDARPLGAPCATPREGITWAAHRRGVHARGSRTRPPAPAARKRRLLRTRQEAPRSGPLFGGVCPPPALKERIQTLYVHLATRQGAFNALAHGRSRVQAAEWATLARGGAHRAHHVMFAISSSVTQPCALPVKGNPYPIEKSCFGHFSDVFPCLCAL